TSSTTRFTVRKPRGSLNSSPYTCVIPGCRWDARSAPCCQGDSPRSSPPPCSSSAVGPHGSSAYTSPCSRPSRCGQRWPHTTRPETLPATHQQPILLRRSDDKTLHAERIRDDGSSLPVAWFMASSRRSKQPVYPTVVLDRTGSNARIGWVHGHLPSRRPRPIRRLWR